MSNRIDIPWLSPAEMQAIAGRKAVIETVVISVEDYAAARAAMMVLVEIDEVIREDGLIVCDSGLHDRVRAPLAGAHITEWRTGPEGEATV